MKILFGILITLALYFTVFCFCKYKDIIFCLAFFILLILSGISMHLIVANLSLNEAIVSLVGGISVILIMIVILFWLKSHDE